jgi:hypothetical protein
MGLFDSKLNETTGAAARDLFERIVAAERDILTDEQKANPREYLLGAWRTAAEAVMRPLQTRDELERKIEELQERIDVLDHPFAAPRL